MFYEKIIQLCSNKGISITRLIVDLKMSKSNIDSWRNGATPRNNTIKKLAEYFDVPMEYLKSDEFTELPEKEPKGTYIYLDPKMKGQGIPPELLKQITDFFTK